MSLMTSIFGGAPAAPDNDEGPGLFASKAPASSTTERNAEDDRREAGDASGDESSSVASSSSESEPRQAAPDGVPPQTDGAPANDAATKPPAKTKEELQEEESRTIFVGNLPPGTSRRALAGIFRGCGRVASARLRSVAVAGVKLPPELAGNQNMMRKVCANTGKFLEESPRKSAQGYVVFASLDSVDKALQLNSTTYQNHTLRVDRASPTIEPSRSVFVGNLPYGADEETLRHHFASRLNEEEDLNEREGTAVAGVRIIRDKETQRCKGFGYVTLRDATLVPPALQLHGSTYMKRELRVMVCGKRTKGNRGGESGTASRRSFEGQRATEPSHKRQKRKSNEGGPSGAGSGGGKAKRRRARSERKSAPGGSATGTSKRAAAERRIHKRAKKLQLRAARGMGKKGM